MMRRAMTLLLLAAASSAAAQALPVVTDDAIANSLTGRPGDRSRGETLVADRHRSLCTLCHAVPAGERHLQGNLAPDLAGIGGRLSEGQIRLRVADTRRLNSASIMPSYLRTGDAENGRRVASAWRGKPVLTAAEIEDVVAYLVTLKD
jgi:sulfur-oxidizing protein SoxX